MMNLYIEGHYAYPGLNAIFYAVAFAAVMFSFAGCYAVWKFWNQ